MRREFTELEMEIWAANISAKYPWDAKMRRVVSGHMLIKFLMKSRCLIANWW